MKAKYIKHYQDKARVKRHYYVFRFKKYWPERFEKKRKIHKYKNMKLADYL